MEAFVNVRDYGAVGDGMTDDYAAFMAAINDMYTRGGGQVTVPATSAFYVITSPLMLQPRVSLVGDPCRPSIQNVTSGDTIGVNEVLLTGNFHPSFTQYLQLPGSLTNPTGGTCVGCDIGVVSSGNTVKLVNSSDLATFAVGDQVWIASVDGGTTGGWFLPHYGFCNVITKVDPANVTLTLRESLDQPLAGTVPVTALSVASGVLTLVSNNILNPDNTVTLTITGTESGLSGIYTVVSATSTSFTVATTAPDLAEVAVTGTAQAVFYGSIGKLSLVNGRHFPLFFSQDCSIENLELVSPTYKWSNDSACLNVKFRNLRVVADTGVYGNTFQYTSWEDCDFFYASAIGELSHNTLHSKIVRSRFINQIRSGVTPGVGFSTQECSRYIDFEDCLIDMDPTQADQMLNTINASHIHFRRIRGIQRNPSSSSNMITFNGSNDSAWPSIDCVVEDSDFEVRGIIGRYFYVNLNASVPNQTGSGIRRVRFIGGGHATVVDSVSLNGCAGFFVKDCEIPKGTVHFSGTALGNTVTGNFVAGFDAQTQTGVDFNTYQNNFIHGNHAATYGSKAAINYSNPIDSYIPNNTPTSIYSVSTGIGWIIRDRIDFDIQVDANGTTGDRTITLSLYDATTMATIATQGIVIPAAQSGPQRIVGCYEFKYNYLLSSFIWYSAGVVSSYNQSLSYSIHSLTPSITVKVDGICASGNSTIRVQNLQVQYSNPFYS